MRIDTILNKNLFLFLIVTSTVVLIPLTTNAHHSFSMYDPDTTLTIKGTVQVWSFHNPHAVLIVEVDEEDGAVIYQLESRGNPSGMIRQGWTSNSIKTGDRVAVNYNPNRSGVPGGAFNANDGDARIMVEGGPEEGMLPMEMDR